MSPRSLTGQCYTEHLVTKFGMTETTRPVAQAIKNCHNYRLANNICGEDKDAFLFLNEFG
jgi:hypothetical protein